MQRTAFGRAWTAGMPAPFWVVRAELACATGPNPGTVIYVHGSEQDGDRSRGPTQQQLIYHGK